MKPEISHVQAPAMVFLYLQCQLSLYCLLQSSWWTENSLKQKKKHNQKISAVRAWVLLLFSFLFKKDVGNNTVILKFHLFMMLVWKYVSHGVTGIQASLLWF